jgi:hypothetical protein
MKAFLLFPLSILFSPHLSAQVYTQKDVLVFDSIMNIAQTNHLSDSAIGKIVAYTGIQFLGTPYVGGVLDIPESEKLVIDLTELDCVTFLEYTIALSVMIKEHKTKFEDFCNEVKLLRYRDGVMNGYASRLHYFYDWIENNQKKGILQNITADIGGKPFVRKINGMSVNRSDYPHLKEDSTLDIIKRAEEGLSSMDKFYIPKSEIEKAEDQIKDGDVIAFTFVSIRNYICCMHPH